MYHTIEFTVEVLLDLEISQRDRLELVVMKKGIRRLARVRPYVLETGDGPVEMSDLFFPDGSYTYRVRCEYFSFVD